MRGRILANLAAAVVVVGFVAGAVGYERSLGARAEAGKPAPPFALPALNGEVRELREWRGRPVVVNFWTTWCDSCREEIPVLEDFHRRYGDVMPIIGVDVREPLSTVQDFVNSLGITYTVLRDLDGKVADRYRVRGYPESWLIDPDGVARRSWAGPLTFEALAQAYEEVTGHPLPAAGRGGAAADESAGGGR